MTAPQPSQGRSPGAILAGLIAILLVCVGVIVWDQTRPVTASDPAPRQSAPAPAPSGGTPAPNGGGFGDLK